MTKQRVVCRLATINGVPVSASSTAASGRSGLRVKSHQEIERDLCLSILGRDPADIGPVFRGNAAPLTPLLDPPKRLVDRFGKLPGRAEGLAQIADVGDLGIVHSVFVSSDNESGQRRTDSAMTSQPDKRTMCPMGKATTPAKFRRDFCRRVRAARVLAGLNQPEAAELLGVKEDTYSKYERRTAMPHYLIPKACHHFRVTPDELFGLVIRSELDREYDEPRRAG